MNAIKLNLNNTMTRNEEGMLRQDLLMNCKQNDFIFFDNLTKSELSVLTADGESIGTISNKDLKEILPYLEEGKSYECCISRLFGNYGDLSCELNCNLLTI